jgi:hypothetical protein
MDSSWQNLSSVVEDICAWELMWCVSWLIHSWGGTVNVRTKGLLCMGGQNPITCEGRCKVLLMKVQMVLRVLRVPGPGGECNQFERMRKRRNGRPGKGALYVQPKQKHVINSLNYVMSNADRTWIREMRKGKARGLRWGALYLGLTKSPWSTRWLFDATEESSRSEHSNSQPEWNSSSQRCGSGQNTANIVLLGQVLNQQDLPSKVGQTGSSSTIASDSRSPRRDLDAFTIIL